MTIKLYGTPSSTCTRRVALILHEKKVPFEFVQIDFMKAEHKSPEYLKKQPFGQIPYIDDDGYILYESRAICRYICAKYPNQGTQLVPTDLKAYGLFEQASSVELNNFDSKAAAAVGEVVFNPMKGLPTDMAVYDKLIKSLAANLDVYNSILSKQKYLAGDEVTAADLYHLPYGSMLPVAGSDVIETRPNVARWFKDLSSRPTWLAVKDGVKTTLSYA